MSQTTLPLFRKVAVLEGISLLLLMGVAMPLKYIWGAPGAVKAVGWVHGGLFIAYVALLGPVASEQGWKWTRTLWAFLAASIPLGTFFLEPRRKSR